MREVTYLYWAIGPLCSSAAPSLSLEDLRDILLEEDGCTVASTRYHRCYCEDEDLRQREPRQLHLHRQLDDDVEDGDGEDRDYDAADVAERDRRHRCRYQLVDNHGGDLAPRTAHRPQHTQLPHGVADVCRHGHHELEGAQDEGHHARQRMEEAHQLVSLV